VKAVILNQSSSLFLYAHTVLYAHFTMIVPVNVTSELKAGT